MPPSALSDTNVHARSLRHIRPMEAVSARTLPIRIPPLAGEALESWLVALAHRLDVTWEELLDTVMPASLRQQTVVTAAKFTAWLNPDELAHIATVTAVDESRLHAMTLQPLDGTLITIDRRRRIAWTSWGAITRQRFCPRCLADNHGRWSLDWRLPWVTVCQRHRCFLIDTCPTCSQTVSVAYGWCNGRLRPGPNRCCASVGQAGERRRCGGSLIDIQPDTLPPDHPVLDYQRQLSALLTQPNVDAGVYGVQLVSSAQFLVDIHMLANRILTTTTPRAIARHLGTVDHSQQTCYWRTRLWTKLGQTPTRRGLAATSCASAVATGTTAALMVLLQPSIPQAAEMLRGFTFGDCRFRGRIRPTYSKLGQHPSPVLCAIDIASWVGRRRFIAATDQLRYRLYSAVPSYPMPAGPDAQILRCVPNALWDDWAFRLRIGGFTMATQRQALALLVTIVATTTPQKYLEKGMGYRTPERTTSQVYAALHAHPQWPAIAAALIRLHDRLVSAPPPIDYRRRCALDYRGLLPLRQWEGLASLARMSSQSPLIHHAARTWLFDRISGLPSTALPFSIPPGNGRFAADRFLLMLTPELVTRLDEVAAEFLRRRGVDDEPVSWSPPLEWLDELDLPGQYCHAAQTHALRRLLGAGNVSIREAARRLGLPANVIRHELKHNPLRQIPRHVPTQFERARAALPEARLRKLYEDKGLSLPQIAMLVGIKKGNTIGDLARSYGMHVRGNGRKSIPATWIRDRSIVQHHTVREMSAELGVSEDRIRRCALEHGIMLREYDRTHPPLAAAIARQLPGGEALLPAIADIKAWRRLRRFARASHCETLAAAARQCGCGASLLRGQIIRLESNFGKELLVRSGSRLRPWRPTAFGHTVADLVHQIEARIDTVNDRATRPKH